MLKKIYFGSFLVPIVKDLYLINCVNLIILGI